MQTLTAITNNEFKFGSNPIFLEMTRSMNEIMSVVTTATELTKA